MTQPLQLCACCEFQDALEELTVTYMADLIAWWVRHNTDEMEHYKRWLELEEELHGDL